MICLLPLGWCAGTLHRPPVCSSGPRILTQSASGSCIPQPPLTSVRTQWLWAMPRRRQKQGDAATNLHGLGSFFSFPKQLVQAQQLQDFCKAQTSSEGCSRHPALAKQLGGAAATSSSGSSFSSCPFPLGPVQCSPSNQMPEQAVQLPMLQVSCPVRGFSTEDPIHPIPHSTGTQLSAVTVNGAPQQTTYLLLAAKNPARC